MIMSIVLAQDKNVTFVNPDRPRDPCFKITGRLRSRL